MAAGHVSENDLLRLLFLGNDLNVRETGGKPSKVLSSREALITNGAVLLLT